MVTDIATATATACPLCGFEFEPADTLCTHGCPLNSLCDLIRCPACDYEFPVGPKRKASWFSRLFGRKPVARDAGSVTTVRDLCDGDLATIVGLDGPDPRRHDRLAVFGVVPGAEIRLVQRSPAYVLEVGQTELALDPEIAAEIVVEATRIR